MIKKKYLKFIDKFRVGQATWGNVFFGVFFLSFGIKIVKTQPVFILFERDCKYESQSTEKKSKNQVQQTIQILDL